ncbi:MAG: hypothetical protein JWQ45_3527 [Blastococcus sp.]|jgi:hypothetical protein|nr:hypothetical protein [Blastococcus sp.]
MCLAGGRPTGLVRLIAADAISNGASSALTSFPVGNRLHGA